ncbi:MAG: DUF3231 family protein [Firmicutes bacterium]|nr:DUF3231 family protein [Bacillota bacterium]
MSKAEHEFLHYGEVFSIWSHLAKAKGCLVKYQILINHCEEPDLASFLKSMFNDLVIPEIKKLGTLLKENGIETPPTPQEKPRVDFSDIPVGARFLDPEIATCVANDIAMNLAACSQIIALSIREDIGMMFAKHHMELVKYGHELQNIMKKHGWLVKPPLHTEITERK